MKSIVLKTLVRLKTAPGLKKIAAACFGIFMMLSTAQAQFTWPVYESFSEYTNGTQLGSNLSSNYWNVGNAGLAGVNTYIVSTNAAMSYPALLMDSNATPAGVQEVPNNTTSADRGALFSGQTNNTIYASFLLNYQDNGGATADRLVFNVVSGAANVTNGGSFGSVFLGVWLTPDYRIQITKNYSKNTAGFSSSTPVLATNIPHLIVLRYLRVAGGNDEADLWVDPTSLGNDAAIPPPTISTTNSQNIASFNAVVLNNRKLVNNTYYMNVFQEDEIRLASDWAGVTPPETPAPGPVYTVSGGGIGCPGDSFQVSLSGSAATNSYWLFTNNIYAGVTVAGTGSALNMGLFSAPATYSILASNNVNGNIGWMSNSVVVYVRVPVGIVTQPVPAVTATNSRAQFNVACAGDQLTYQWYKDGVALADNSHIAGSATSTLVIWPANTADIGNYYCGVINPCSISVTYTTTNSLSLDQPSNLIYSGNSFSTPPIAWPWDIAVSSSWNGGGAVFNEGDNVTFDDTYNTNYGVIIPLTGTLTPTLITYATVKQLTFGGTGTIAGTGGLLFTGSGRLTISNLLGAGVFAPNPYTGGTVIDSGTVYIQSWNASLGTGPITLAGGILESKLKGNAGVGLSNNILVTANSTWQTDQSGQQSASLFGTLVGNPGTSLTFSNNSTAANSMNWVYLNTSFTNGSAIVLSSAAAGSNQRLIFNNGAGSSQVYNGVISEATAGIGGVIHAGGGAVYLNAANTYTISTTNSAGLLAGSGSINSPLVVGSGGTLGGGSLDAIGTFTVNGNMFLNGSVYIRVNKSLSPSNDSITVSGVLTNSGTGTLIITNLGGTAIAPGDTFKIFSSAVSNGAALTVADGNTLWTNKLAIDGTVQALSVIPNYSTNISYTVSSNSLTITWPSTHLGWILQTQTNSLAAGLGANNWFDVSGSAGTTSVPVTINTGNPAVFYRLRHP